jgi:hypothetical protein
MTVGESHNPTSEEGVRIRSAGAFKPEGSRREEGK